MNHHGTGTQETERESVESAIARLLDGRPERSNGACTIVALAAEADVSRQRLYEHHGDLIADFQTRARGGPTPPNVAALQQRLAAAEEDKQLLKEENTALRERLRTLTAVIVELTQQNQAENVIQFPTERR